MDNEKKNKRKTIISVASLILLLALVIGITYAVFTFMGQGNKVHRIITGVIEMSFKEQEADGFTITDLTPMTDEEGKKTDSEDAIIKDEDSFHFSITSKSTGHAGVNYEIMATKQEGSTLDNDDVRIYLEKKITIQGVEQTDGYQVAYEPTGYIPITQNSRYASEDDNPDATNAKVGDMILERANINKATTVDYRLKMWVSDNAILDENSKTFKVKINAYGTDIQENLEYKDASGANAPELKGDMIPVIYDVGGESWVKAEKTGEWYNYGKQMWANVVTIADEERRKYYVNAVPGTKINIEEVNTMWVWIPRYAYAFQKTGNTNLGHLLKGNDGNLLEGETNRTLTAALPGAIDIKFISTDSTPFGAGNYDVELTDGHLYTPSSFCWGDSCDTTYENTRHASGNKELAGIWVSKFEMTGSISEPTSIPNRDAVRNQVQSAFFNAIKQQMNGGNGNNNYGFGTSGYDTHMIKNTEWGAFTYLSQSIYGKYGNSAYSGENKEIYINNYYSNADNSVGGKSKTGCSAGRPVSTLSNKCLYEYDYLEEGKGIGASTTGTIYGIYDVSGGAWEMTMGKFNGINGASEFTTDTLPPQRYYNNYTSTVTSIKGDALKETEGFYRDYVEYINEDIPWYIRSGRWGTETETGIFGFASDGGGNSYNRGTRMVLISA